MNLKEKYLTRAVNVKNFLVILILAFGIFFITKARGEISGVIGPLDWIEVSKIENQDIQRNAKTVGVLYFKNSFCNAFVIDENKIMTNNHCISKDADLIGSEFHLNGSRFNCRKLLAGSPLWDYSVIECINNFGESIKPKIFLGKTKGYVITNNCNYLENPNCKIKKMISFCEVNVQENRLEHACDTFGGSSGSPIFSDDHFLLGIHWGHNEIEKHNSGTPTKNIFEEKFEIEIQESLRLLR